MSEKRILVVDDNPQYRSAVVRNLTLAGYTVSEAEDSDQGMQQIQTHDPHVVITDLDMRTHDEGLEFIKKAKSVYPSLPMIMISAVGTFDEGALAQQYGASCVLSKSRIDQEIETLYKRLDQVYEQSQRLDSLKQKVDHVINGDSTDIQPVLDECNRWMQDPNADAGIKSEIYDMLDRLERMQSSEPAVDQSWDINVSLEKLRDNLPEIDRLDAETKTMLGVAEQMYHTPAAASSMERNIGFSYSFAVENEVKVRTGKKVTKFLASKQSAKLAKDLYDTSIRNLDIFFGQHLIRTAQQEKLEINADITRQVLERMIQHETKYKPDGLKALGVILYCWGQTHTVTNRKGKIEIKNPLGIRGLDDRETVELSNQLIALQHLRNPYIHPEFSERDKTESVRQTALTCLSLVSKVV
jgi:CheY-like chemotaxis protein